MTSPNRHLNLWCIPPYSFEALHLLILISRTRSITTTIFRNSLERAPSVRTALIQCFRFVCLFVLIFRFHRGAFSVVREAIDKVTGQRVAVKVRLALFPFLLLISSSTYI